jgi:multidrug efflux pump subunit AcrA (membrane-fusion protein)
VNWKRVGPIIGLVIAAGAAALAFARSRTTTLVLTGIVTTNEVIVGPQIAGRLDRLLVREGDTVGRN